MRLIRAVVSSAALIAVLPGGPAMRAQSGSSAAIFDDTVLHEVRLFINSRDLRQFRERFLETFTIPADLVWRDTRVRNVGLRSRGAGSRNPVKLGIEVSFDRYTTGQEFQGLRTLILDNLYQDPSLLREYLGMNVFRRLGQHASRESFARLYINNELQGVYGLVEPVDARYVTAATTETDGRLFEFRWTFPFFGGSLGENIEPYQPLFAPRGTGTDTPSMLYSPIRDLFTVANELDAPDWRERLDRLIDLPQLVTHVAVQGCLGNDDGFMGYAGLNNFYLYRHAGTTRHRVFPWDEDFAFTKAEDSILRHGDEPVPFITRALAEPDLRTVFLDAAEACARTLSDDDWMAGELDRLMALVGPAILGDPKKPFSNENFLAAIEFLRAFATTRPAAVLTEAASLR